METEASLYKANEFSTKHLKSAIKQLEPNLAKYEAVTGPSLPCHSDAVQGQAPPQLPADLAHQVHCHGGACTCRLFSILWAHMTISPASLRQSKCGTLQLLIPCRAT
ncbi:hypothetical protein ABZP36_031383 [Zizania latifolia]